MIDPDAPITASEEFFGRESVVKRIFSRIGAERPQSIAVIGGRKSGKTSLLNYMMSESTRSAYLANPGQYIFTLIRSDSLDGKPEQMLKLVIGDAFGGVDDDRNVYASLQKLVEPMHAAGKKLIVLFDDFHLVTGNKEYPLEFFSFFRSLANNYNVAYVTTSFLELQQLCVVKAIEESPFFNIFTNLSLGLFTQDEAARYLQRLANIPKKAAESIIAFCGPSPYLVKMIAWLVEQKKVDASEVVAGYEKSVHQFFIPYFEKIVSLLPRDSFNPLRAVVKNGTPDIKELHHLRTLVRHGFLIENGDKVDPFSEAFGIFLKKNLSQSMLLGRDGYGK
jgi:eukaryotic-like serine/threonine-protein kinase